MTDLDKTIQEDWSFHLMIVCATLIIIVAMMTACNIVREKEHTKQKLYNVEAYRLEHVDPL